jgi:pilus assembly protein Flp/PilA
MVHYFRVRGYPNPIHHLGETMLQHIKRLVPHRVRDEETGASAVEYGLLVAAIAALIVLIVFALGGVIDEVFSDTCDQIETGATAGGDELDASCTPAG